MKSNPLYPQFSVEFVDNLSTENDFPGHPWALPGPLFRLSGTKVKIILTKEKTEYIILQCAH